VIFSINILIYSFYLNSIAIANSRHILIYFNFKLTLRKMLKSLTIINQKVRKIYNLLNNKLSTLLNYVPFLVGRGRDRHIHRREYNSIKLSKLHAGVAHNGAKERVGCVSRPRRIRVSLTILDTRSN